ncbi:MULTISPECIES: arsenate reductase family protein [Kitasatospora]|uniref:Putative arsenate reductase n=1 Tax=Kitasatospora setae (strain ATCC 33774 / DSM 43861 / JCM 3304 / KCC A-0304 / NBRC 14216 / KM-6054) TaxID=452652 RepID=E4NAA3_KITSK|nr:MULTISPECIES: arsenate reductase family protein [Kitasatospora]BAJ28134.1 putative arsenate reductase [Kitasatospora setae KM-6054]
MEIWINPRCGKCRTALGELDAAGAEYTVRHYLDEPPTAAELTAVLDRLGLEPWNVARLDEAVAKELGLRSWGREQGDRARWVAAMTAHPKLIQRPIITADDGYTVIGRTPDALKDVLSH